MRYVTRIHLSDCGWHEAYYPGTTIDLRDPRTGRPRHTVFSLENTGGKTSFLSLVLSCFDTHERRFLKTLIRPNQRFGDYFGDVPAFILVEWDLSGSQGSLLEPGRLVTGQVVAPRGDGPRREIERRFFTFRSAPGLTLDSIPSPGLDGFGDYGRLNGYRDVQRWLHEMRSSHPGNFQDFERHKDWRRKLAEERIDTELLAAQVDFNRNEGGIEDFLSFRSESGFVRKFLSMTMPDSEAGAVRAVVAEHVGRLANLPQLERRRDAMRRLRERFAPFVEIADKAQSADANAVRRNRHAVSLQAALAEHGRDASYRAGKLSEEASGHEAAAEVAAARCREARVRHASATVETARRRHEAAKALAETRERELDEAKRLKHLLAGAVALREILDDRARSDELRRAIDAQHADLQPLRDELSALGADLQATLHQRAVDLRERQGAQSAEAEGLRSAAQEAGIARSAADESARAERLAAGRIERDIEHAESFRAALEQEQILESDESAEAASQRHERDARSAEAEARELRRQADVKEREGRDRLQSRADFEAERCGLEVEIGSARDNVQEGEAKRRALVLHSTIIELTGESEVDPDADGVARVLAQARSRSVVMLRDAERRQEVLEADRESLEVTGLASIDKDVRAVAERLRESGIRDTQPYAVYLSEILRSPKEVRQFAERDPARFVGVAVPNRDALERAREVLKPLPTLSRPVVVAVAADSPRGAPDDRFVLPVDDDAAYDREAARELQRRIEDSLAETAESIRAEQDRIEHLKSTHRDLEAWRERFGGGRLEEARRGIERREARLLEIGCEIEALSKRIAADERDARACRDGASEHQRQAHACTDRARRAGEHRETWESKVEDWRLAELRHEHAAQAAEQRAREKEAERDRLEREARDHAEQARKSAAEAADIESEIGTSCLRNSWGLPLGAVLNSPGEHHLPWIGDWMLALEDRQHAERWK